MIQSATERHSQPGAGRLWPSPALARPSCQSTICDPTGVALRPPASNLAAHRDPLWSRRLALTSS